MRENTHSATLKEEVGGLPSQPCGDAKRAATEAEPSARKSAELYQSAWNPPGYRKSWDRCSMMLVGADRLFATYASEKRGPLVECVAWFDDDGDTKAIVGDFAGGSRIVISYGKRNTTTRFMRQDFPEAGGRP
jgi:hypothetical protein